jgi:hypothetical protein
MDKPAQKRRLRFTYLLLLIPYGAMLWVPFYNRIEPKIAGVPFFYWYQLLWIVLGAAVLLPAYLTDRRGNDTP